MPMPPIIGMPPGLIGDPAQYSAQQPQPAAQPAPAQPQGVQSPQDMLKDWLTNGDQSDESGKAQLIMKLLAMGM